MKDGTDSTAVRRAPEAAVDFANRKLIRPSLSRPENRNCIKIVRSAGQGNLLIYKPAIKYMFKEAEDPRKQGMTNG